MELPRHLRLAGLYHSVYGTEVFTTQTITLDARRKVKEAIGEQAEEIAYLYFAVHRPSLYANLTHDAPYALTDRWGKPLPLRGVEQLRELMTLDVANRIEQIDRTTTTKFFRAANREIYERAAALLPPPAVEAFRAALPRMSKAEFTARRAGGWLIRRFRRLFNEP